MTFYTFQIKILDVTNRPVPGAIVRVYCDDEPILQEESGSDGCIIFNGDLSPYLDKEMERYKVEVADHTHLMAHSIAYIADKGCSYQ